MDISSVLTLHLWIWINCLLEYAMHESGSDYTDTKSIEDSDTILVFTSLIEPPFLLRTYDNTTKEGELDGFLVDLVQKIAEKIKMPYRLQLVSQGGYGVQHNGKWNGMIGELVNGEADIAAGALSVNALRQEVIDFSRPYMKVGIATVVKKEGQVPPIMSPWELANRQDMDYGMIPGTLTQHFFKSSNDSAIRKMWNHMYYARPSVFEWTSRKGIERVRESNGKYAFFVESAFAEYLVSQPPCDLMLLDQFFNPKEYAFAVPKGSKYLKKLNHALRQLLFSGYVDEIFHKWWHGECDVSNSASFDQSTHDRKRGSQDRSRERQQDMYHYEDPSISYDYNDFLQNGVSYQNDRTTKPTSPNIKGWTRSEPRSLNKAIMFHLNVFPFMFYFVLLLFVLN